ncbi:uncharacterized protein LTR77_002691 [Saxophila tyrrhenica]|uniref:Uncharacterized protein n=1 Tax=Saxophila tyrrhenica TaxID=1690608 RepID=A0AAV9PFY2_9PEZI|nr:hypothetical protein LTR77_002691 [Saxophila tyrrhenica]
MYRHYQPGNADEQQYQIDANSQPFVYSSFQHPTNSIEPQLQQTQHLSPPRRTPGHSRHTSNESNIAPGHHSRSLSPQVRNSTPSRNASFTPTDRTLPSRHVTADSIVEAYVAFILYCNPNFSLDVDTTTLRTNFQSPPKSDNKDFEIYRLFELLRKFDAKEIKTWGQLALDLGVEAPDVSKGQSVQKVQQYSVRLKRWMRAMHVDAFFEYLLGKNHAYYQEVPHPNDPYPPTGRDGVLPEEDLAIRALDPSFRPKRGRRRNSETEQDEDTQAGAQNTQANQPQSAYPASAYPSANMSFNSSDPWANASAMQQHNFGFMDGPQSAIVAAVPSHMRWQNPSTPYPMTAHPGSMTTNIDAALSNEPKSAITPSARKRRKHGPAVSSAWPSGNAPGAKPRGRPPASRNVQDGPFSTFPADPSNDKSNPTFSVSVPSASKNDANQEPTIVQQPPAAQQRQSEGGRPGRLSLQVPKHSGGPVRLATPPRVMVTNETSESEHSAMENAANSRQRNQKAIMPAEADVPGFAFEALKRVVASDLLRAELLGRQHRLNGEEAKRLADAVLQRLNVPRADSDSQQDNLARLTAASWLGVGEQLNVPLGPATGTSKRLTVTRFRVDADGYEEVVSAYDMDTTASREVFDLSWSVTMGTCNGLFELKGLSLADPPPKATDVHDRLLDSWIETARRAGIDEDYVRSGQDKYAAEAGSIRSIRDPAGENVDWRAKYKILEFGARMAKGEFARYRERLVEKVLDTII